MAKQIALGSQLYLYTGENDQAQNLLVTAHGACVPRPEVSGGWFKVPSWTQLVMYAPHKAVLTDPGLGRIVDTDVNCAEVLGPGAKVRNYRLRKYENDTAVEMCGLADRSRQENKLAAPGRVRFDVLALRDSGLKGSTVGITLKSVLEMLEQSNYVYSAIHCSFCRWSPLTKLPDRNVSDNTVKAPRLS